VLPRHCDRWSPSAAGLIGALGAFLEQAIAA
jgi:hypothetical protein